MKNHDEKITILLFLTIPSIQYSKADEHCSNLLMGHNFGPIIFFILIEHKSAFENTLSTGALVTKMARTLKANSDSKVKILELRYYCHPPIISNDTQMPISCKPDNSIDVVCRIIDGINCFELNENRTFIKRIENGCQYTSGKDFQTALLLSIFLGWLGIDRFYLGYWTIGLFKMCTFGFFLIFHLIDMILIAIQIVGPSDGTFYRMDYFGPKMSTLSFSNVTDFRKIEL